MYGNYNILLILDKLENVIVFTHYIYKKFLTTKVDEVNIMERSCVVNDLVNCSYYFKLLNVCTI